MLLYTICNFVVKIYKTKDADLSDIHEIFTGFEKTIYMQTETCYTKIEEITKGGQFSGERQQKQNDRSW